MKFILVSVLLVQVLSTHASSLFGSSETLLTKSQDDELCSQGKEVKNLCASTGHADHECKALAKIVEGTDVNCSQPKVCSFKIEGKSKKREVISFLKHLVRKSSGHSEEEVKYSGIVHITTDKKLNFEKKPGIIRICKENLVIVNPERYQLNTKPPSNKHRSTPQSHKESYDSKPTESTSGKPASPKNDYEQTTSSPPPSSQYQTPAATSHPSYNENQASYQPDKQNNSAPSKDLLKLPSVPSLDKVIPKGIPNVKDVIPKGIPNVKDVIPKEIPNVKDVIPKGIPNVNDVIPKGIPNVKDEIPKGIPNAKDVIPKGIPNVKDVIPKGIPNVKDVIPKGIPNVKETLGGLFSNPLSSTGSDSNEDSYEKN